MIWPWQFREVNVALTVACFAIGVFAIGLAITSIALGGLKPTNMAAIGVGIAVLGLSTFTYVIQIKTENNLRRIKRYRGDA